MAEIEIKNYAFLSYSPQDNRKPHEDPTAAGRRAWGDWLAEALKQFSIPPEFVGQINGRGELVPEWIATVFSDASELAAEASLSTELRAELDQSRCLVVICSPHSARSRQVDEVVRYFKQLGRSQQIFPIVVAGEPYASTGNQPGASAADECFVPSLRHPVQPDGTLNLTRLASKHIFVDARHGVEKREILATDQRQAEADLEMAKIQLIALLIGVGFNGLWWREQKRHFIDFANAQQQTREALNQVAEVRQQLELAQRQAREAQQQSLAGQNLPQDVEGQIREAHQQAQTAQNQAREAQQQLQEFQNKVRELQSQLEAAISRARAAESKVLEAQQAARESQNQLEATRIQARENQHQALEIQNRTQASQTQEAQNQILNAQREAQNAQRSLEEIRQQAQDAQNKLSTAQSQVQEFQNQAQTAQRQLAEARQQARGAQDKFQAIENQTRDAQNQIKAAQAQVQKIQDRDQNARRLTKVFAVLAALALLAAGVVATQAWRQRQAASQALTKAAAEASGTFDLADAEPIQQLLQNIGGAEQNENRQRSLDHLAAGIPPAEIPEALKASAVIADDQQRCHFQKWLIVRLGWVNPLSAMTNASAITGKIVNDDGRNDSNLFFQLAVLDNWIQTDWPAALNWVGQLPDADSRQRALDNIIHRLQTQADSAAKNQLLANCLGELAKNNFSSALTLAESLPEGSWRDTMIELVWMNAGPFAVSDWINSLLFPPDLMSLREASMGK
jgi:uncharacterized coiled-coil DUF342 family protein